MLRRSQKLHSNGTPSPQPTAQRLARASGPARTPPRDALERREATSAPETPSARTLQRRSLERELKRLSPIYAGLAKSPPLASERFLNALGTTGAGAECLEHGPQRPPSSGYLWSRAELLATAPDLPFEAETLETIRRMADHDFDWQRLKTAEGEHVPELRVALHRARAEVLERVVDGSVERLRDRLELEGARVLKQGGLLGRVEHVQRGASDEVSTALERDGRIREYSIEVPEGQRASFGPALTLLYFAPGSQTVTSDQDAQLICPENPAISSAFIEAFYAEAEAAMGRLRDLLPGAGLEPSGFADLFDVNAYPPGFAYRPESNLILSPLAAFTPGHQQLQQTIDTGLSLIRVLEHRPDCADVLSALSRTATSLTELARAADIGMTVALESLIERARLTRTLAEAEGLPGAETITGPLERARALSEAPGESVAEILLRHPHAERSSAPSFPPHAAELRSGPLGFAIGLAPRIDASGKVSLRSAITPRSPLLAVEEKIGAVRALGGALHAFAVRSRAHRGAEARARLDAYLSALGGFAERIAAREQALTSWLDAPEADRPAPAEAASDQALLGHLVLGKALYNANEAYLDRGTISDVVEAQMGHEGMRVFYERSVYGNVGFVCEHAALAPEDQDLGVFLEGAQKYISRAIKALGRIEHPTDRATRDTGQRDILKRFERWAGALEAIRCGDASTPEARAALARAALACEAPLDARGHAECDAAASSPVSEAELRRSLMARSTGELVSSLRSRAELLELLELLSERPRSAVTTGRDVATVMIDVMLLATRANARVRRQIDADLARHAELRPDLNAEILGARGHPRRVSSAPELRGGRASPTTEPASLEDRSAIPSRP